MKKQVGFLGIGALMLAVILSGCGSILVRPGIDKVKTVALVSVYMNRDFYNVKAPKSDEGKAAMTTLGRAILKETKVLDALDNAFTKEFKHIISYAVRSYSEQLDGVGGWQWKPVSGVVNNPAYQDFVRSVAGKSKSAKLVQWGATVKSADYHTAPGMVHIPLDRVAQVGTTVYAGDAKDPKEDMRKALGKLCKDLGVDAVAIVELDMGYKKPALSLKLIGDDPATPNISAALVMVNKDGELAVNTGPVVKGQGPRYEGKTVGLLRKGYVHLSDKGVDSYCQAAEKSAAGMRKRLTDAFSKLK